MSRKIALAKPVFDKEMRESAIHALLNERFVLGESVSRFEEEFSRYCGTKFAISTGSGTAALVLSLLALDVRGAEVVTSPASFVASGNSIIHAGAVPRFIDISIRTYTVDPAKVEASLNERVKALIPVHLYGFPAAMDDLRAVASKRGIPIIEDACQAHGASYNKGKVGSLGDIGCFSFYPSKNMMVCGDGGMIVTDHETVAESVASLRDCGRIKGNRYIHSRIGFTERLNTVQAAIGRVQLKRLEEWNDKRRQIARTYDQLLSDLDEVITPPTGDHIVRPVYHMYVIRCKKRDDLRKRLVEASIECAIHYPIPIHLQPIYRELFGYKGGEFLNAELLSREALSIPMHPGLTVDELNFVSEVIHDFYNG